MHRRSKMPILQSLLKKIISTVSTTAVFWQFLLIAWPYTHNFSCGETLTYNWCPKPVLLHYFAIKLMFKAFYWKHFSIILYGKSQTMLIISRGECTINFTYFSGCWASFVCNCHSILECCVMFSGVKLSTRSFDLLLLLSACEQSPRLYVNRAPDYMWTEPQIICEKSPRLCLYVWEVQVNIAIVCWQLAWSPPGITTACISYSLWASLERICTTDRTFHRSAMMTFMRKQNCEQWSR